MRKVILEVGEVGENLVILDDVWELCNSRRSWLRMTNSQKILCIFSIQIVENYTILAEKRLNSRWLNCIHRAIGFLFWRQTLTTSGYYYHTCWRILYCTILPILMLEDTVTQELDICNHLGSTCMPPGTFTTVNNIFPFGNNTVNNTFCWRGNLARERAPPPALPLCPRRRRFPPTSAIQ